MRRISEWRHNKDKHKRNPRIFYREADNRTLTLEMCILFFSQVQE